MSTSVEVTKQSSPQETVKASFAAHPEARRCKLNGSTAASTGKLPVDMLPTHFLSTLKERSIRQSSTTNEQRPPPSSSLPWTPIMICKVLRVCVSTAQAKLEW